MTDLFDGLRRDLMLHDTGIPGGGHLRHPDECEEGPERLVPVLDDFGNAPPFGCHDRTVFRGEPFSRRTQEIR